MSFSVQQYILQPSYAIQCSAIYHTTGLCHSVLSNIYYNRAISFSVQQHIIKPGYVIQCSAIYNTTGLCLSLYSSVTGIRLVYVIQCSAIYNTTGLCHSVCSNIWYNQVMPFSLLQYITLACYVITFSECAEVLYNNIWQCLSAWLKI